MSFLKTYDDSKRLAEDDNRLGEAMEDSCRHMTEKFTGSIDKVLAEVIDFGIV